MNQSHMLTAEEAAGPDEVGDKDGDNEPDAR